jgi:hypothetical protein
MQYKRLERAIDEGSGEEYVAPNNRLTPERLEKLRAIDFAWTAKNVRKRDAASMESGSLAPPAASIPKRPSFSGYNHTKQSAEELFEEMIQRLAAFKEREGHVNVPRKYEIDPSLATWVEQQRSLWNRAHKLASTATNAAGDAVGCAGCHAPPNAKESCVRPRASGGLNEAKLNPEQKARLDALGFVWSLRDKRVEDHWDMMFQQVSRPVARVVVTHLPLV